MISDDNGHLKRKFKEILPEFSGEEIESFLGICTFRSLKNKAVIIEPNKKSSAAFFILKGVIRGYLTNEEGVEKSVFLRPAFTIIGAPNSLFDNKTSKYTFEVIGDTELLVFELSDFENLAFKSSNILKFLLSSYKEMIQTLIYRVESMIDKTPEQRYEDLLDKSPQFFQTVYHKDIASYLGITPVSLSRIIKRRTDKNKSE
jgi:CRP-like cAMP-binding protein